MIENYRHCSYSIVVEFLLFIYVSIKASTVKDFMIKRNPLIEVSYSIKLIWGISLFPSIKKLKTSPLVHFLDIVLQDIFNMLATSFTVNISFNGLNSVIRKKRN